MSKHGVDAVKEALDLLRADCRRRRSDYRNWKYELLASTMKVAVELRSEANLPKFLRPWRSKLLDGSSQVAASLTASVLAYVTGARTPNSVKLAWKYARVLEYLHDKKKVPLAHLAREMKVRGGIERLTGLAAQENPRRKKNDVGDFRKNASVITSDLLLCKIGSKMKRKIRSLDTGTVLKLIGVRTTVRGLTAGAIFEVRKIITAKLGERDRG